MTCPTLLLLFITMKRGCLLFFLFLLISAAASSCQQWLYGCSIASQELPERPNELITPRAAAEEDTSKTKEEDVVVVHRCRAEELSPGAALGIVIVLATGSVLHMPGSLLNGKSSLYRLAPELGIFELIQLLLYVGVTFFFRRRSLKLTVTAILVWRYERQYDDDDDDDDNDDDTSPITMDEHGANPFLDRIQTFGLSRILGDALMVLAFIKSATVKGTVRTNFLAVSYMLPFCTIELLSFAAVRLDPRPKTRAQSEAELAEINNLIQEVKWSGDSTHKPDHLLYKVLSLVFFLEFTCYGRFPYRYFFYLNFRKSIWGNGPSYIPHG